MARRSGPTLYEAMSRSAAAGTPSPSAAGRRPTSDPDRPAQPALLTPGSAVRVPVGYVWVLVIVVLGLSVGSFLLGHARGVDAGRVEMERTLTATDQAARETARLREPVVDQVPAGGRNPGTPSESVRAADSGGGTRPSPIPPADTRPSDVLAERRESGKWYYQIITTTYDKAVETATLVSVEGRTLGLDAQVVPGDTGQFATVILHPGFDKASMSDEDQDWWPRAIRELGSRMVGKVTLSSSSERPFSDAFPKRHP